MVLPLLPVVVVVPLRPVLALAPPLPAVVVPLAPVLALLMELLSVEVVLPPAPGLLLPPEYVSLVPLVSPVLALVPAPPPPPCFSPLTNCQTVGMAASRDAGGYAVATSFGRLLTFGDFPFEGDESSAVLDQPIVGVANRRQGGYYLVAADGVKQKIGIQALSGVSAVPV